MNPTSHDLPPSSRQAVISICAPLLADLMDLFTQAKQAHWTVRGPLFGPLHALFDDVAEAVEAHADLVAERIAQLGGHVRASARAVAAQSRLPEYPLDTVKDQEHLRAMVGALATAAVATRKAVDAVAAQGDQGTADILTEISRGLDELLWKVEAHAA